MKGSACYRDSALCLHLIFYVVFLFCFQDIQERIFNWERMVKMVDFLKTKIQEESKCRLDAVAGILDQLTIKSNLSLSHKEELLTGLHKAFWEQVAHYNNGK